MGIAERMLLSNQFSYAIPGCVQQVLLGCTIALQCNPDWVLEEFDLANAHTACSRGLIWEEFLKDDFFYFLIQIYINLYGDTCTTQWRYENGPD